MLPIQRQLRRVRMRRAIGQCAPRVLRDPAGAGAGDIEGARAAHGAREVGAPWVQFIMGVVMVVLISALFSGCSARAFENLKTQVGVSEVRVDGRILKVFTLAALNTGDDPIKLRFSSGMQFDFVVTSKDGTEVWRWSSGKAAIMMLTEREIAPGELAVHSVVWDGTDSTGAPVPPGEYKVHAEILTRPRLATGKVAFALGNR